jgi:FkbM family methyltransferase
MKIGGRDLRRVSRALSQGKYYKSILKMAFVCPDFPGVLVRYLFGTGRYPYRLRLRTPLGMQAPTVYSHGDVCTVNEIFCRDDYKAGADLGVVVDIGGNIGLSALYFLTRNQTSRCYLYEPLSFNVERLQANLAPFADRVVLQQLAVADREGVLSFGVEPTGRYGGLRTHQSKDFSSRPGAHYVEVECVHINSILADVLARENTIDLLKIDTEGAEADTVAAIDPAYRRRIGVIYMEASGYSTTVRLEPNTRMETLLPGLRQKG